MTKRACDASVSAERIKQRRKQLGLTQKELAQKIGISLSTIKQYELGKRVPDGDYRAWLADALMVNERWLVGSSSMNFQSYVNEMEFVIRDKRSKEYEEKTSEWSDVDRKRNENIKEALRQLNKPLALLEDLLRLSNRDLDTLERNLLVEYGLTSDQYELLVNTMFSKILSFAQNEFDSINQNAYDFSFYSNYTTKKEE